jgi:AraC-like DNA-binding protein
MAESRTLAPSDADGYAARFGDARITLTITGAGDFQATLTRFKLKQLEAYRCHENLPRIAYISLPPERIFLSFPLSATSLVSDAIALRKGDMFLHGCGSSTHQRFADACEWGLISLSPRQFGSCSKALTGRAIASPHANRILRPARADVSRFQHLFGEACHLAEAKQELLERPGVARALEQELLHAIVNCLAADDIGNPKIRRYPAIVMSRFEEALSKHINQKSKMPSLCAEIGVPERTLRIYCAKFLGVSPTRYLLLRRLNKARSALRHADPSMTTVAQIARKHHFGELGRFAVTYRTTFGESPSVTLQRER